MSVLSVIADHCKIHALGVPTSIIGSTDTQTIQLFAILKETLEEMVQESKFNVTTKEAVFSCMPSADQGDINDIAEYGYQYAIPETFYDRTNMRPLYGPLTESEWQARQATPDAGPNYSFRIWNNHLFMHPTPVTPSDIAFEYMSSWYITDSSGTLKENITADSDLFVFPENIVRKGMMFRWKQIKGLPYQADEKRYWDLLNNYIARDKVKKTVNIAGRCSELRPVVGVPLYNSVPN